MAELSSPVGVLEIATVEPWVTKGPSPWVRGPVWDGFWMLSALWLAPVIFWLSHGYSDPESSPLDLLYFGLTVLFWIGHRLSSTYLAYCTEAYRPLLREQPVRFIVLPLLVVSCRNFTVPSGPGVLGSELNSGVLNATSELGFSTEKLRLVFFASGTV